MSQEDSERSAANDPDFRALFESGQETNRQLQIANETLARREQEISQLYQRLSELDQLKTQFFANVSHELRTPLALVVGPTLRLLESDRWSDEERYDLELVRSNSALLLGYVNDLLDLAKVEAGKMTVNDSDVELPALLRTIAAQFEGLARQRNVRFRVCTPIGLRVRTDVAKVQRIVTNLLSNAFKWVPNGGEVTCALVHEEANISLTVDDSGPGVPPSVRDAIFDRFIQGEHSGVRRPNGSGLGLAIVKELATLLGGSVAVHESPQGGARFQFVLPFHSADGSIRAADSSEPSEDAALAVRALEPVHCPERVPSGAKSEHPLVLIVEDNRELNAFVADVLSTRYRTASAFDGDEGLAMATALRPDLILTDVTMPKMSGNELLTALRSRTDVADIPAIVLTARNEETLSAKLLRGGAQDYVMKPFAPEELCARIDNLLAARQATTLLQQELSSQSKDLVELTKELVTHKREIEAAHARAEASSRTKDEFLSLISHELRTPLTPLLLGLDLLRDKNMEPELWDDTLDRLEQCARTEQKLVEDLLDVSKSLSGKLRIELEPVILRAAIEAALESIAPSATAKSIRITARIAPDIGTVLGDSARLQQIVWNLLSNSVKFTPAHGRVEVRAERRGGGITITVSDTGIGIAPTFLPHVFDRFRQADSSTSRPYGGLGVGLAIVRELAELHGGRVHAASAGAGTGATFTVELPLASAVLADPRRAKGFAMLQPAQPLSGLRILVAEDDRDTLDTLTYLLIYRGAEVKTATSGPEALLLLQGWLPDILVSDIGLPGQDGYELIRLVRALAPERGASVPAVALTAYAREEDQQRCLSSGFQGHIAKPFDPSHLVATLRAVADRSTRPRGGRRITDRCA